jgi:hypothetical protein
MAHFSMSHLSEEWANVSHINQEGFQRMVLQSASFSAGRS